MYNTDDLHRIAKQFGKDIELAKKLGDIYVGLPLKDAEVLLQFLDDSVHVSICASCGYAGEGLMLSTKFKGWFCKDLYACQTRKMEQIIGTSHDSASNASYVPFLGEVLPDA